MHQKRNVIFFLYISDVVLHKYEQSSDILDGCASGNRCKYEKIPSWMNEANLNRSFDGLLLTPSAQITMFVTCGDYLCLVPGFWKYCLASAKGRGEII